MRHPLLQKYDRLIEFFGQMLGQDYELSLFDLRAEGCPLIFIAGGLNSGRPLGTPLAAAGLSMLERFRQGDREPLVNSHSVTADGRLLRSSAVILADGDDEPEGLLSVRFDDNRYRDLVDEVLHLCHPDHFWQEIEGLEIAGLNRPSDSGQASAAPDGELTAAEAVRRMLLEANTTADALTSEERLHIISELEKHGYFRLKGAVREVTRGTALLAGERLPVSDAAAPRRCVLRGTLSPLDTPPVPKKPGAIPPSPLHGRGGSGHESRGSGVKVRQSWTFTEIFYAALCGAPVLPVLPKAKCGRRLRTQGVRRRHATGVPSSFVQIRAVGFSS